MAYVVKLAVLSGEAVSFGFAECGLASAAATAAAKPVAEPRHSGITENSAPRESAYAVSPGEAGFYGSSTGGMQSAGATGIVQSFGEARPPAFVECSGTKSESEHAESLGDEDEAGSSWSGANGMTSAFTSAKYVDGARPLGIAKCATTESVLAISSDEESSDETGLPWSRASGTWSTAETAAVAKSVDGVWPPEFANAKYSAKCVGEARFPGIAKTAVPVAVPAVAKSVDIGEARPPEFAKDSATTAVLAVNSTVEKSDGVGEARPPEFAKFSTETAVTAVDSTVGETVDEARHLCEVQCRRRWH